MGLGLGNITVNQRQQQAGAPFSLAAANNGLSVDPVTKKIVLGQLVGALGDPAILLNDREIPIAGNAFTLRGNGINFFLDDAVSPVVEVTDAAARKFFEIAPAAGVYGIGDIDARQNNCFFFIDDNAFTFRMNNLNNGVTFANNAAAIVGGLVVGMLYRITATDQLAIVH